MPPARLNREPPQSIALLKLCAIGDLVMASTFIERLRRHYPQARIVLFTGKSCARIHEHNPNLNERIVVDDAAIYRGGLVARLGEAWHLWRELRRGGFDRVYIMHRARAFNLLALLTGIPDRIGYDRGGEGLGLTLKVVPQPHRNEREIYLDLLRAQGLEAEYTGTRFYLSAEEDAFLARFTREHHLEEGETVAGIGPGGGDNVKSHMPSRRWPVEMFIRLARELSGRGMRVLIFGGPRDAALARQIHEACPASVDATHLTVGEMASVFRRCRFYLGNDSGPLHIAEAMGIPTLGLFGPTDPRVQAPMGPAHAVINKNVACSPCFDNGHFPDCAHIECLRTITVEEVLARLTDPR